MTSATVAQTLNILAQEIGKIIGQCTCNAKCGCKNRTNDNVLTYRTNTHVILVSLSLLLFPASTAAWQSQLYQTHNVAVKLMFTIEYLPAVALQ